MKQNDINAKNLERNLRFAFCKLHYKIGNLNDNILRSDISFYAFFRNEDLQILEFYFCENILLKFHYKLLLATNSAVDEAKTTSIARIWKEICGFAFCKLHYKLENFNDNISKNDISFYAFSEINRTSNFASSLSFDNSEQY